MKVVYTGYRVHPELDLLGMFRITWRIPLSAAIVTSFGPMLCQG